MQEPYIVRTHVDRFAHRVGVPAELAAIGFIVLGVLMIAFPQFLTWMLGLILVVAGMWHLALSMQAHAPRVRHAEDAGESATAKLQEPGSR